MTSIRKTNEYLTQEEQKKLAQIILGYGRLTAASDKSGITDFTLRNISRLGYGHYKSVRKIRKTLLGAATNITNELQKAI